MAAVDLLGNEGALSETKEIVFPVSPVRNLVIERLDNAAPVLSWQPPAGGSIVGYHLYRNGMPITQAPIIDLGYTDGYYSGGTVTYGVSAIDTLGNESPVLEVSLYDISVALKPGTSFRRGLLEVAQITLSIQGEHTGSPLQGGLSIDALDVKVGTAPSSAIEGPFVLTGNSSYQVEKVVSTTADAPSTVSVIITARWSPTPGATVKVTKTLSSEVAASGTAFEIFNDPLVRGTDARVRLKVNNIGSAQMEFLTSENAGVTKKVAVKLKDEDGNLLSTGYLDQRVGNAIVNTGPYAVARMNPNENILTEPVIVNVPMSAPYKVYIEASIENTYYHYGKADQVTGAGMRQTVETVMSEAAYRAEATPEHEFYPNAQPVVITGRAISNQPSANGELVPAAFVPVKLGISVRGFDRFYSVTTDADGAFSFTFTPAANEAGLYSVWAVHPDVKDRTGQATFAIAGLAISPETAVIRMARGKTLDIPVTVTNYGGASLTGLTFNTQTSAGIEGTVQDLRTEHGGVVESGLSPSLAAGAKASLTLRLTASSTATETGFVTLTATTTEGLSVKLEGTISIVSLIPVINTTPSYIDTGMVKGNQKIESFNIKNVGEDTLRNARIEGPSTTWMTLAVDRNIGDLAPGASRPIGIMLNPPATVSQGVYDDKVVIYSDNHIPYTYHIQVTVTSDAVGSVYFDVMNELMEKVPNATITVQHQTLTELIYTLKTGPDGSVMQADIPEGRYAYNVTPPPGHTPYSGSFIISPGLTTTVPIALEMNMVTVTWSVEPTTIQDQYQIVINQTFETNVPVPVLIAEPPSITLPDMQPGQVFNGEFTVTNQGLIQVSDVKVDVPVSFMDYDIEVMTSALPTTIGAMKKVTVPYRITRRLQSSAGNQAALIGDQYACNGRSVGDSQTLYDEVQGYGGSGCWTSFNIVTTGTAVICPNTPQQRTVTKSATQTVIVPLKSCPPGAGGASNAYVPPQPNWTYYAGTPPPPQPVGGSTATNQTVIQIGCECDCRPNGPLPCNLTFCCYQGNKIPNVPINDLKQCPDRKPRKGYAQGSHFNGCGPDTWYGKRVPNNPFSLGDFRDACNHHDACYDTCLSSKTGCDLIFCVELVLACNDPNPVRQAACLLFAGLYCAAVNKYGDSAYEDAQKQACACCYNN